MVAIMVIALMASQGVVPAGATWQTYRAPEVVSVGYLGADANAESSDPDISDDGRYVVFESYATNLVVPDDAPSGEPWHKVFRYDRLTGQMRQVNEPTSGPNAVEECAHDPRISDDGRYVAFDTYEPFVPEDTNDDEDIYVRDMSTGEYIWIDFPGDGSGLDGGVDDLAFSGDGSYIAFSSYTGDILETGRAFNGMNVWGYDLESQEATLVSVPASGTADADRGSRSPAIDDSGRYVVFLTGNDWDEGDTNDEQDLYVRDMETGELTWIDFSGDGSEVGGDVYDIAISGDGSRVVFSTDDSLLPNESDRTDVYSYDLGSQEATLVSGPALDDRGSRSPSITDDGRYVSFYTGQSFSEEDVNGDQDVYVKDMVTGEFKRIPLLGEDGLPGDALEEFVISGDGEHLAFDGYLYGGMIPRKAAESGEAGSRRASADDCDGGAASKASAAKSDILGSYQSVYHASLVSEQPEGASRLAGADRYATAIDVSRQAFPEGSDTVIVATGENWPDALAGAGLAGALDAPILLTRSGELLPEVKAEILRLHARDVYILGSEAAVSAKVENRIDALVSGFVWRIGGSDRYATSKAVANRAVELLGSEYDGKVCVVTGEDFADAVSSAPLGAGLGWPIVLVRPADSSVDLPPRSEGAMIAGSAKAVGTGVEDYLESRFGDDAVDRMAGDTRYETSAMVADYGVDHGLLWDGVGISTGLDFPDALSGGVAVGLNRSPLLLTTRDELHPAAAAALNANAEEILSVRILGGAPAVGSGVVDAIEDILGF